MDNLPSNIYLAGGNLNKEVPGLHPGLNDLIRVLGKQAHCASRTLVLCDVPCSKSSNSVSKYHKNCGSPKKGRSWDSLCRPSSLWSPIRPETYYYDCFFYRQYPDRDTEYQEIEEKYRAIKEQSLDYSPPECDPNVIKAIASGASFKPSSKVYAGLRGYEESSRLLAAQRRADQQKGSSDNVAGPGIFNKSKYQSGQPKGETLSASSNQKYQPSAQSIGGSSSKQNLGGSGSKSKMATEGDSVPCAELAEIRDLLKKSDRETIRRMQEMLSLMKELSVREICRATCDGSPGKTDYDGGSRAGPGSTRGGVKTSNRQLRDDLGRKKRADDDGLDDVKRSYQQDDELRSKKRGGASGPEGSRRGDDSRKGKRTSGDSYRPDSKRGYKPGEKSRKGKPEPADDFEDSYDDSESDDDSEDYDEPTRGKTSASKGRKAQTKRGYGEDESKMGKRAKDDGYKKKKLRDVDEDDEEVYEEYDSEEYEGDDEPAKSRMQTSKAQKSKPKKAKTKGSDEESLSSSSESKINRGGARAVPASPRERGKARKPYSDSGSESEYESSSTFSESSTTDVSQGNAFDSAQDDSDLDESSSTAPDDEESHLTTGKQRKQPSSRTDGKKSRRDVAASESESSLSSKDVSSSLSKSRSDVASKTGLEKAQAAPKQSGMSDKSNKAGPPDQPGRGASNLMITVGDARLTVHETVELSNVITDIIVLEIVNELLSNATYVPPSRREPDKAGEYISTGGKRSSLKHKYGDTNIPKGPSNAGPSYNVKPTKLKRESDESQGPISEGRTFSSKKRSSKQLGETSIQRQETKLELEGRYEDKPSSSKLATVGSDRSGKIKSASMKQDKERSEAKKSSRRTSEGSDSRSSCPRHSRSLSPGSSSRRRSSSTCRLELEKQKARSAGPPYEPSGRSGAEPPKPWERRLSSQLKAESIKSSSKPSSQRELTKQSSNRTPISYQQDETPSSRGQAIDSSGVNLSGNQISQPRTSYQEMGHRASDITTPSSKSSQLSKTKTINRDGMKPSKPTNNKTVEDRKFDKADIFVPQSLKDSYGQSSRPTSSKTTTEEGKRGPRLPPIASACEPSDDVICANYDTDDSILYYARITDNAYPPVKETFHSAGFMLRSAYDYSIPPRSKISVKTDLLLQLPRSSYGRIAPRKCLAENFGIDVGADVIDRDYRENITVVLFNHGDKPFTIQRGNKVAQLICESIHLAKVKENADLLKA